MLEAACGYPAPLMTRIKHPVVWMGACIAFLEQNLNKPQWSDKIRRFSGALAILALLALTLSVSLAIASLGWLAAILGISALLAQRSLYTHVADILSALKEKNLPLAREKLSRIVGRDTQELDEAAISRAAIESLAESFCDGVIAPLFWALLFGLPGIICYKAINTADSMIGHKDARYLHFGFTAAKLDDLANWIPARISAVLIALAACLYSASAMQDSLRIIRRDARKHASPNAGWPEAAMAGALGLTLAGPNIYEGVAHEAPFIGEGTREATRAHIRQALALYVIACALSWLMLAVLSALR